MDHLDMFGLDMAMDSMPQAVNNLDLSPSTVEGDFLFSYPDTSSFVIASSSNSLLNFPETQDEVCLGDMLLSGSLDLDFTL